MQKNILVFGVTSSIFGSIIQYLRSNGEWLFDIRFLYPPIRKLDELTQNQTRARFFINEHPMLFQEYTPEFSDKVSVIMDFSTAPLKDYDELIQGLKGVKYLIETSSLAAESGAVNANTPYAIKMRENEEYAKSLSDKMTVRIIRLALTLPTLCFNLKPRRISLERDLCEPGEDDESIIQWNSLSDENLAKLLLSDLKDLPDAFLNKPSMCVTTCNSIAEYFLKFFAYLSFGDEPVSPSLQKIILPRDRIVIVNICSTFEIDRRGIFALINDSEIFQVPKIPHKFDAETITIPGDILFDEFKLEIQSHAVNIKANLKARQI